MYDEKLVQGMKAKEADCWWDPGLEAKRLRGANPNSRKSKLWDGRKKGRSLQRSCVMWLKEGKSIFLATYTMESSEGGRASALQQRLQARREMFLKSESSPAQATPSAQVLEVCLFFNQWRNKSWVLKRLNILLGEGLKWCTWTKFCSLLFLAATRQLSNLPLLLRNSKGGALGMQYLWQRKKMNYCLWGPSIKFCITWALNWPST